MNPAERPEPLVGGQFFSYMHMAVGHKTLGKAAKPPHCCSLNLKGFACSPRYRDYDPWPYR